jgi:tRNA dimethylallyltransferase
MSLGSASTPDAPLVLAGPTASGKSACAMALAECLGGEIISVDSMQVYRGMDIGTAKPSAEERARVPHHLIDLVSLKEGFDAARFCRLAAEAVAEIQSRGRRPILCGGTGLYFKALLEGLGEAPPANAALRAELEAAPLESLLEEIKQRDPATWERLDRANPRRVVRALEVIRLTGKPFSEQRAAWSETGSNATDPVPALSGPVLAFGIGRSPGDLRRRIDVRVDEMFQRGLVQETSQLLERGLEGNRIAMQALGYRQVVEHLRGLRSLPETIELVKIRTRQFAKRQMTWFRNNARLYWIMLDQDQACVEAAERILARIETRENVSSNPG